MRRRIVLQAMALGLPAALLVPVGCNRRTASDYGWSVLAARISGLPSEQNSAIGKRALDARSKVEWIASLPELPDLYWQGDGAVTTLDLEAVSGRLREITRRQFDAGQSLELNGWLLSELECALCALSVRG